MEADLSHERHNAGDHISALRARIQKQTDPLMRVAWHDLLCLFEPPENTETT
jgi:hypothetical protein